MLLTTIGYGASCIAGQDKDGTLALAVTLPVSRQSVLLQKQSAHEGHRIRLTCGATEGYGALAEHELVGRRRCRRTSFST